MSFTFHYLDGRTRQLMLQELERDIQGGTLYLSSRLSPEGRAGYPSLIGKAIADADEASLASDLQTPGTLNATEQRRKPTGGFTTVKVPMTAAETLAYGEFNRFYARALCLRAIEDGIESVIVYRAKQVTNPRLESEQLIGQSFVPADLLNDLRTHPGIEPSLGLPPGPNSGLSITLPS